MKNTKRVTEAQKTKAAQQAAIASTYKRLRKLGYSEAAAAAQSRRLNTK